MFTYAARRLSLMPLQTNQSEEPYPIHGRWAELAAHYLPEHLPEFLALGHEDAPLPAPMGIRRQEERRIPSQYVASSRSTAEADALDP